MCKTPLGSWQKNAANAWRRQAPRSPGDDKSTSSFRHMKFPFPLKYTALIMAAACGGFSVALAATVGATGGSASVANTGRAAYSIPLEVPPAPLGSQPKLALVYNSEAGNRILRHGGAIPGLSGTTPR